MCKKITVNHWSLSDIGHPLLMFKILLTSPNIFIFSQDVQKQIYFVYKMKIPAISTVDNYLNCFIKKNLLKLTINRLVVREVRLFSK
jgi:hypothetical protein